jgi:hypothetical protein
VNGTSVFWSNTGDNTVQECSKNGCDAGTSLASSQSAPGIAVDSANVYWVNYQTSTIQKCAVGGCGGIPTQLATTTLSPYYIALDSTAVYWATRDGLHPFTSTIGKCALGNCAGGPVTLANGQYYPGRITVAGSTVYWTTEADAGSIASAVTCGVDGCDAGALPLTLGGLSVGCLVVDSKSVYFTTDDVASNGLLMRCPLGGCSTATQLAFFPNDFCAAMAQDSESLYIATSGTGKILRLAK